MTSHRTDISREEYAQRGEILFEHVIAPRLSKSDHGKFIAIDIESGEYEIDKDDYLATERLLSRLPGAHIWLVRAGHAAAYRLGGKRSGSGA